MRKLFAYVFTFLMFGLITGCAPYPPLIQATMDGDINAVRTLLDRGEDINVWYGGTPLITASCIGNTAMVKLLLDRGADVNAMSEGGESALGYAAEYGHVEIVKMLINKGANVDNAIIGLEKRAAYYAKPPTVHERVAGAKNGIRLLEQLRANP